MIATTETENDLVGLRERQRQLGDRLSELRSEQPDIVADVAACEQDWLDAITVGEDSALLGERLELRRRELASNLKAAEHVGSLFTGVDSEIGNITARQQLADDVQAYHGARIDYAADLLPGLPDALPACVEVISDALDGLLEQIEDARNTHDQLAATAGSLHQRAQHLGAEIDAPQPPSWSDPLERIHGKETLFYQLMLAVMQRRGAHAVLDEIERVINIGLNDKRRAAR